MKSSLKILIAIILALLIAGIGYFFGSTFGSKSKHKEVISTSATQNQNINKIENKKNTTSNVVKNTVCLSRARVENRDEYDSNGSIVKTIQIVSVDNKEITDSMEQGMNIRQALVSLDCKYVAWVVEQKNAYNNDRTKLVKPDIVRYTLLNGTGPIHEVVLSDVGPAILYPFKGVNLVVAINSPEVREYIPSERELENTFYKVNLATGKIEKIGSPFRVVSPDFKFSIRKIAGKAFLQNRKNGQSVVLSDNKKDELAMDYAFSPDGKYLAYIKLTGTTGDYAALLDKMYGLFDPAFNNKPVYGKLLVRNIMDGTEYTVTSGDYRTDIFYLDRWISNTKLEWFKSGSADQLYQFDVTKEINKK